MRNNLKRRIIAAFIGVTVMCAGAAYVASKIPHPEFDVRELYRALAATNPSPQSPRLQSSLRRVEADRGRVHSLLALECHPKPDGLWECACTVQRDTISKEVVVGHGRVIAYVMEAR